MKKILSLIAMITFMGIYAVAANTSSDAKKVLDKAAAKVNVKSGTQMGFTISGGKIGNQSGTITIKGKKFNARIANAVIWYDGKTQWTYLKKNNEVNVSTPDATKQAQMNPYAFLNLYKNGYNLSLEKAASGNMVHLTAQGKKSISEMYILVDSNSNIKQVKLKQSSGWTTINITSVKNVSVSDATFQFSQKEFPKAEVIDLR